MVLLRSGPVRVPVGATARPGRGPHLTKGIAPGVGAAQTGASASRPTGSVICQRQVEGVVERARPEDARKLSYTGRAFVGSDNPGGCFAPAGKEQQRLRLRFRRLAEHKPKPVGNGGRGQELVGFLCAMSHPESA